MLLSLKLWIRCGKQTDLRIDDDDDDEIDGDPTTLRHNPTAEAGSGW